MQRDIDLTATETPIDELDRARLQERFAGLGLTAIAEVTERHPVRVVGEVRAHSRSAYGEPPLLAVTINDGTGIAVAMFDGRRRIAGLDCGRTVIIEGVGRRERGELVIHNPAYTLIGAPTH